MPLKCEPVTPNTVITSLMGCIKTEISRKNINVPALHLFVKTAKTFSGYPRQIALSTAGVKSHPSRINVFEGFQPIKFFFSWNIVLACLHIGWFCPPLYNTIASWQTQTNKENQPLKLFHPICLPPSNGANIPLTLALVIIAMILNQFRFLCYYKF